MVMINELKVFWPLLIAIGVLLVLSAFFSMSETALISLNKIRLRHLMSKGNKKAKLVYSLISNPDRFITGILVGNNIVNTAISVLIAFVLIRIFGEDVGMVLATVIGATLLVVFGEIIPKVFAVQHSEKTSLGLAVPLKFVLAVLAPVARIFYGLGNGIIKAFGGEPKRAPLITEEEIRLMIELGKEEGVLGDEERKMLHRIFEFGDTLVSEVMIPKEKIIGIDVDASAEELLDLLVEEGHARVPAYKGSIDRIEGILYARDLLYIWQNKGLVIIPDLLHQPYFIPKNKRVSDLLKDFQRMRIQMAIVVDDKKQTIGLITLEDLIEEIVGEIDESLE
ncbi:MAG: hemolysin family protein [Candidatus Omnitrophica bacterium]|nr:hemolysin family protein [Candidatus Omnitrophota bacterium]